MKVHTLSLHTRVAALTVCLVSQLIAQHEGHASMAPKLTAPVVDGATKPELITDEAAIHMFVMSLATPPNGTSEQSARLRAVLSRAGFSNSDLQTIQNRLLASYDQLKAARDAIEAVQKQFGFTAVTAGQRELLVAQHKRLVTLAVATHNDFLSAVSLDGAQKLKEHIQYVKSRIKIVPPPRM